VPGQWSLVVPASHPDSQPSSPFPCITAYSISRPTPVFTWPHGLSDMRLVKSVVRAEPPTSRLQFEAQPGLGASGW
jgi:hypothetical protein